MRRLFLALLLSAPMTGAALAHPHVWVTSKSQLLYNPDGRFAGVRHAWTFDDVFSSFATQGLDTNNDGVYSREELQALAQTNVESLREFNFFTGAKLGGAELLFANPTDYWLDFTNNVLTLHFTLPLATAQVQGEKPLSVSVYDPTFFVDFSFARDQPISLVGAPAACKLDFIQPAAMSDADKSIAKQFDNEAFRSLDTNANFGARFADHALVNCP